MDEANMVQHLGPLKKSGSHGQRKTDDNGMN